MNLCGETFLSQGRLQASDMFTNADKRQSARRRTVVCPPKIARSETMVGVLMGSSFVRSYRQLSFSAPCVLWSSFAALTLIDCRSTALQSSLDLSLLLADAVKRSTIAHLFHFYPVICEIASIPRRTPSTWVMLQNGEAEELDARVLARHCLKEVGKEMGVEYLLNKVRTPA